MIDWGNVPSWISAATGFAALTAAGFAAKFAYGQLTTAEATLQDRRDETTKEQASKVAAWLEIGSDGKFHAYVFNSSDLPVYKTTMTFISPNNHNPVNVGTVGPMRDAGDVSIVSALANQADEMHYPRLRLSFSLNVEEPGTVSGEVEGPIGPVGVTISFTDANSRRWNRDLDGDLTRVAGDFEVIRDGIV